MASSKRKSLTQMTVIKNNKNGKSARRIAEEMGVGRTQIQGIIMNKSETRDEYEYNYMPVSVRESSEKLEMRT